MPDDQPQPGAARITGMKEVAPDLLAARPSRDLVIQGIDNGYWFWGRPSIADLIATCARWLGRSAQTGTGHARPAGNWETGDHALHHPYQTVRPQTDQHN